MHAECDDPAIEEGLRDQIIEGLVAAGHLDVLAKARAKGIGVVAVNANDPAFREVDGAVGNKARAKKRGMKYAYVIDETSDVARHVVPGVERIIFRMPPALSDVVLPMVTEAASIIQAIG